MNNLKDISKIANCINVQDFISDFERISSSSLSQMRKQYPKKYKALITGMLAYKLDISIDDLKAFAILKNKL
jgi:hypothetical protein